MSGFIDYIWCDDFYWMFGVGGWYCTRIKMVETGRLGAFFGGLRGFSMWYKPSVNVVNVYVNPTPIQFKLLLINTEIIYLVQEWYPQLTNIQNKKEFGLQLLIPNDIDVM